MPFFLLLRRKRSPSTNARGTVYEETTITEITESECIIDSLNCTKAFEQPNIDYPLQSL